MKPTHQPQAIVLRWKSALAGLLLPLSLTVGCSSTGSNTGNGLAGGAILGGIFGTLLGAAAGRPLEGAAIGAASGAAIGGVTGAAEDRREQRYAQMSADAYAAAVQRGQAELTEIARMAQAGVGDALIIEHVQKSGAIWNLSGEQIIWLKQQGVSETVIQAMNYNGPVQYAQPGYPYYYRRPVVVVEQPPPVAVGIAIR